MFISISINSTIYTENFYHSNEFYVTIDFGKYDIRFDVPYSQQRIISYKKNQNEEYFYFSYYSIYEHNYRT
jgi:hypothetical protein